MTSTTGSEYHRPVLVDEVVGWLKDARTVLDGTLGGGGHSEALLRAGVPRVIGVDRDAEAIAAARSRLSGYEAEGRFLAVQSTYADAAALPELASEAFGGVLLDLGVSSHQLDDEARGFTFREGAPLDMRMGEATESAAALLNTADERALATILREYGDEPRARRLAREIARRRQTVPFATSDDLVKAIRGALGPRSGPADFARIFQAVRIAVNDELSGLDRALVAWRDRLQDGGIMAVITYHSGEDRLVKHAFRDWSTECVCPPRQPRCTCRGFSYGETLTRKGVQPSEEERARNPRARSAKLRVWRRDQGRARGTR